MTERIRKERVSVTPAQKLEYVKLMVDEGYSNQQIMDMSGVGATAVIRWKRQYQKELKGDVPNNKVALDPQNRRIQELEKQLAQAQRDNVLLKKATAFFIRDNPALK
jgi:transposase